MAVDLPHLLAIYTACAAIRAVLVAIAYALNNAFGSVRFQWKWALITTWGGLRGAVGLALGMIVFKGSSICANIKTRVMASCRFGSNAIPSHVCSQLRLLPSTSAPTRVCS